MPFQKTLLPRTVALAQVLQGIADHKTAAELIFWEKWELGSRGNFADFRVIQQLRRANPALAAAFRAEVEPMLAAVA